MSLTKAARAIVYECGDHHVIRHPKGWYEIYRFTGVVAERCAVISTGEDGGRARAIAECKRLECARLEKMK